MFLWKDRLKLTPVKVMSHLFHVVVSVRREIFQIIQSMCVKCNLYNFWPLKLKLCWEAIFLMQTLILLPINSVKCCGKRDSPKIALHLYVINTKMLVEYFSFLPFGSINHFHIATKVEATSKLIYWNMPVCDIFDPFISLVKINCPSSDFQMTKSWSYFFFFLSLNDTNCEYI